MNELQQSAPEMGIKDFLTVLRRRKWVIIPLMLLCLGAAIAWTLYTPKIWRAEAQLMLVQRAPTTSVSDNSSPPMIESMETEVGMIQSSAMAERTLAQLKNDALVQGQSSTSVTLDPQEIQEAVRVTNPIDSNLLDISADAPDRKDAAALANAVAHAFVLWKRDIAQRDILDEEQSLQFRAGKAHDAMLLAEQKVTAFKQAHHLADVDVEERGAIEQFENADATVMALNQETASQQARVKALDASLQAANAAINSPGGVPDPSAVLLLQAKLNDLKTQRAILRTQITPDYPSTPGSPSLGSLDAEIRDFQGQLDRAKKATSNNAAPSIEARGAIAAADTDAHVQEALTQARLTAAIQSRQALQKKVQGLPGIRMQYAQLSQTAELASTLYTSLQAALNVTRLQKDQVSGNIQITQGAVLMGLPVKPNLKVNLLLALALGTLLSLCLVMLLEQMDQRVRTLDEIRALVAGPIIGMLPQTSRRRMNALTQGRMLPEFEEPFSLVRVNLSYVLRHAILREDLQHQIILVTSAVPGEGKSVTASQLAFSMAEAGKSVILVDANLRRPVQGFLFQTGETRGLANVLGGELALDEAIATSDVEGLSILHSGESRQNPTALLSSPRLGPLMESLRFKADVIIVDAPDCSSAADTLLLTAHADCLLQVVRAGYVEMDLLHNASLALHATGKKVTVLANGLTQPQQRIFKSRFAYAALTSSTEISVLPKTFEKTMIVNHSQDLVFSKSLHKPLENAEETPRTTGHSLK